MNDEHCPKSGAAADLPGRVGTDKEYIPIAEFDDFSRDLRFGTTVGSQEPGGLARHGIDAEGIIGIRRNALRFRPLATHGWARAAISYGPYKRRAGLAAAFYLLNSHNGSETYELEPLIGRIRRWLLASETDSLWRRLRRWPGRNRRETTWRRLRCWLGSGKRCGFVARVMYEFRPLITRIGDRLDQAASTHAQASRPGALRRFVRWVRQRYYEPGAEPAGMMNENLAVGWFPVPVPEDPRRVGNSLVVRGVGPHNGELTARKEDRLLPLFHDLLNIPMSYIVVLRDAGAAYYAASLAGARAVAPYPMMRPLAIDLNDTSPELYAGVYPAVMGEVGFSADTVLRGAKIADTPELDQWYGTAVLADRLIAPRPVPLGGAEQGGAWRGVEGQLQRSQLGAASVEGGGTALLTAAAPIGLVHSVVDLRSETAEAAIRWRSADADNYWEFSLSVGQGCLQGFEGGVEILSRSCDLPVSAGSPVSLQILDDGMAMNVSVDGIAVFGEPVSSALHASAAGAGFRIAGGNEDCFVRLFEAHPRFVPIPSQLRMEPDWIGKGSEVVLRDDFVGPKGALEGKAVSGNTEWRKLVGSGQFEIDGMGAVQVDATPERPVPDRTAYGIRWGDPAFADIAVRIHTPGTQRDDGNACRGGIIFWQDPENYFIVNIWLDDIYPSAAASSFFYLNGFEDVYDAVWSNLGDRVRHGGSYELRVLFDGDRYCVYVDDEPVLYRAISDVYLEHRNLEIRCVGLVANWEWGHDTGSRFSSFVGRSAPPEKQ